MSKDYPWYEHVEGQDLLQGDFLDRCPILIPPKNFHVPLDTSEVSEINVGIKTYDVVIMSQSCDLVENKLELVLVCPHWSLEELGEAESFFKSEKAKEDLRRGNMPGYHMLAECNLEGNKRGICVVDFRAVYSLPFEFLQQFAGRSERRVRLLSPYREHLSQAFARFFMRVGLPVDIPSFKKKGT